MLRLAAAVAIAALYPGLARGKATEMVVYGSGNVECPCQEHDDLATCANFASDLWMQGEMDVALKCMDIAITTRHGSPQSRDAAIQNLRTLYGIRLRTDAMRFYHGYNAKEEWIFPPLGVSKGFKDRSIRLYDHALSDEFCDYLVELYERDTHLQYPGNILGKGVAKGKKNMEIDISDPAKGEWADVDWVLAQKTTKYLGLYEMERSNRNLANTGPLGDEGFRMKRYLNVSESKGGKEYHTWHSDGGSANSCYRALAVVFYLNDVEEGGETVFLTEGINIKPKKGSALIWPTGFQYIHAGLPPISGPKYIITNFLRYTAPRIFNTLDIPVPEALKAEGAGSKKYALPGGGQDLGGAGSPPPQPGGTGVGVGVPPEGVTKVPKKRRKRRRKRKKGNVKEATCAADGTCAYN